MSLDDIPPGYAFTTPSMANAAIVFDAQIESAVLAGLLCQCAGACLNVDSQVVRGVKAAVLPRTAYHVRLSPPARWLNTQRCVPGIAWRRAILKCLEFPHNVFVGGTLCKPPPEFCCEFADLILERALREPS